MYFSSAIKIPASDPDSVAFELTAIVDPVSRGAQKLGPILNVLQQTLNCNVKVFLNCLDKNSDMPLKRYRYYIRFSISIVHFCVCGVLTSINASSFYRFVLEPELQFTSDGQISGAIARFNKLPTSSLLTQHIHAPENWLVEVVRSVYDLDNIKLDNVAMGIQR